MARGLFGKPSLGKVIGAYRSQWNRALLRLLLPGYGKKGMGWWRDPKKAWYNFWYYRTSISLPRLLGYKPSRGACLFALAVTSIASLVMLPFDIVRVGVMAHKVKRVRKARTAAAASKRAGAKSNATASKPRADIGTAKQLTAKESSAAASRTDRIAPKPAATAVPKPRISAAPTLTYQATKKTPPKPNVIGTSSVSNQDDKSKHADAGADRNRGFEHIKLSSHSAPEVTIPDENTPKSKPKHTADQYIKKRMIIAGSSYCDPRVLAGLAVGDYIDLRLEPDNPYDKGAVMLTWRGEKIGYVPKQDKAPFATCLRLGRKAYGVITEIRNESFPAKYEFEVWFDRG